MIIRDKNGVMVIEESPYHTEKDIERFNQKYGINKWRFSMRICSYLEPACGYGQALTKTDCPFCDGKCLRPQLES